MGDGQGAIGTRSGPTVDGRRLAALVVAYTRVDIPVPPSGVTSAALAHHPVAGRWIDS